MRVITGTAGGTNLKAPEGLLTRPTADRVKQALFNIIQYEICGDVLDLFAGSGQLGIEALSRGAARAVLSTSGATRWTSCARICAARILRKRRSWCRGGLPELSDRCKRRFRLIFLDPPYAEKYLENSLKRISEIDILAEGGIIITERPKEKPLDGAFSGGALEGLSLRKNCDHPVSQRRGCYMKIAVYPGSFDPVTKGHLNIIERAFAAVRPADRLRDGQLRKAADVHAERAQGAAHTRHGAPSERHVDSHDGLLADYAQSHGCCTIIKGLRAGSDFEKNFRWP